MAYGKLRHWRTVCILVARYAASSSASAAETAFREQAMMAFQVQLTKRQDVVPMTRDYIRREEARLRALEGGGRPPLRLAGE